MSSSDRIKSLVSTIRSQGPSLGRFHVVVCGVPSRLATVARASLRLASFRPPPEEAPAVPIPHAVATMPLGDSLELLLYVLPLVPAYAPLWPMTLASAQAVVRLDQAAARLLDEACAITGQRPLDAAALVPTFAEDDEESVGELVRAAMESALA